MRRKPGVEVQRRHPPRHSAARPSRIAETAAKLHFRTLNTSATFAFPRDEPLDSPAMDEQADVMLQK